MSNYNVSIEDSQGSATLDNRNGFQQGLVQKMYDAQDFKNTHDIAGVRGIVKAQTDEIDNKKVQFRMANEFYLRKHPEINKMMSVFLFKILDDKPKDIKSYAGKFFDNPKLKEIIELENKHYSEKK